MPLTSIAPVEHLTGHGHLSTILMDDRIRHDDW